MKNNWLKTTLKVSILAAIGLTAYSTFAEDVLTEKNIGMELARDIANEAVLACRKDGYNVSAVVVDRYGIERATLRDDGASRFTIEIAHRKANMTVMEWSNSGQFRKNRPDIQQELNHIDGLIVMEGGVKIVSGGYNLGAVGVSGAPGGDKDEICANKALEKLNERIEFAIDD